MKSILPLPSEKLIKLTRHNDWNSIFDVDLINLAKLKQYNSCECQILLYPYSRKITAKQLKFFPFEEYVKDVSNNQRSVYSVIERQTNKFVGIGVGLLIALVFYWINPGELLSIQSVAAIIGAYIVGKEIWDDLDKVLVNMTKNSRVRFLPESFSYELESHSPLTQYSTFAKSIRYQKSSLLPDKIDFLAKSNSQIVNLAFGKKSLEQISEDFAHILSLRINPGQLAEFEKGGYLFAIKLGLKKNGFLFTKNLELFQAVNQGRLGCLEANRWVDEGLFSQESISWGKFQICLGGAVVKNKLIIEA